MPMKYVRLNLTGQMLTRKDFINQPQRLFVLPDNLPDYRLPRHRLHTSTARGGLAAAMRPYKIGGTDQNPIYDVNVIGVPTLSFKPKEPLKPAHIEEAFEGLYALVGQSPYKEIVVPYTHGVPAFGGGVAGPLPRLLKSKIQEEFDRLERFLNNQITFASLPLKYKRAFILGLNQPIQPAPNSATSVLDSKLIGLLTFGLVFCGLCLLQPYLPLGSFMVQSALGLTLAGASGVLAARHYPQEASAQSNMHKTPSHPSSIRLQDSQTVIFSRSSAPAKKVRFNHYQDICQFLNQERSHSPHKPNG